MSLTAGSRLGPYEILSPLGAGGMGEVYRARDTRLDRAVAIKVLPERLSADPEFRRRFEREAKTISQLSHPHICALHDVGCEGEIEYLVMELLEGETLSQRLARGPLPLDQLCRYGSEIADALGAAHAAGVVHRDLKPGNVMITKSGVKLLDFGLARQIVAMAGSEETGKATASGPLTEKGAVVGTLQYMAPEQLEGKDTDARTDIFALGATLYQMATGRYAFEGSSPLHVASAILSHEPTPMAEVSPLTPPALERLVRRCLAKDPEERWQSARDVGAELKFLRSENSATGAAPVAAGRRGPSRARAIPWAIALLAVASALWLGRPGPKPPVRRFRIFVDKLDFGSNFPLGIPVLSPDGGRIAFRANGRLWIRNLDRFEAREVPGTERASAPFWSFDGNSLAYVLEKKLWRVPAAGGEATVICSVPDRGFIVGGAWSRYGRIAFGVWRGSLYEVEAAGGEAKKLVELGPDAEDFHTPAYLPDGRTLIYAVHGHRDDGRIALLSRGRTPRVLLEVPYLHAVAYSPTGHLVYGREIDNEGIWAVPFSADRLRLEGPAFPLVRGAAFPSLAADGSLIYVQGRVEGRRELVWVSRDGKVAEVVGEPQRGLGGPMLSPDGNRVAFAAAPEESADIWVQDLSRGTRTRVASSKALETSPAWLPSGDRLIYSESLGMTEKKMVEVAADGSGGRRDLGVGLQPRVAPDGRFIAYHTDTHGELAMWYRPLRGEGAATPFLKAPGVRIAGPEFSRDGRWALYQSNETGQAELFVCRFPEGGDKTQVSRNGSGPFIWSRRGDAIYYVRGDDLMEVLVRSGATPTFEEPKALFSMSAAGLETLSPWGDFNLDVSPDGQRFLATRRSGERQASIFLVQNWQAELPK